MAPLISKNVFNIKEDLSDLVEQIAPEETPFYSMLSKQKLRGRIAEWLVDDIGDPDKDNASAEGAAFTEKAQYVAQRRSSQRQIFTEYVDVSRTLMALDTVGAKDELIHQTALKTKKMKIDAEAALVSENASFDGSTDGKPKLAGMGAWISTNVSHGTGGSTPGFSNGAVAAPVAGTTRVLTEAMFTDVLQQAWNRGGSGITKAFAPTALKVKMGEFVGNAERTIDGSGKVVSRGIKVFDGDFHAVDVIPHRFVKATTVIAFDPEKWALGVVSPLISEPLGKQTDGVRKALTHEITLICRNERANAKVADVRAS